MVLRLYYEWSLLTGVTHEPAPAWFTLTAVLPHEEGPHAGTMETTGWFPNLRTTDLIFPWTAIYRLVVSTHEADVKIVHLRREGRYEFRNQSALITIASSSLWTCVGL